jgi:hypothetical protein
MTHTARRYPEVKVKTENNGKSWRDSLPFPKHWLSYVVLKIIVLAIAAFLVFRFSGLL